MNIISPPVGRDEMRLHVTSKHLIPRCVLQFVGGRKILPQVSPKSEVASFYETLRREMLHQVQIGWSRPGLVRIPDKTSLAKTFGPFLAI